MWMRPLCDPERTRVPWRSKEREVIESETVEEAVGLKVFLNKAYFDWASVFEIPQLDFVRGVSGGEEADLSLVKGRALHHGVVRGEEFECWVSPTVYLCSFPLKAE